MTNDEHWQDRFLSALRKVAPEDPEHWDRGALAELRRGLHGESWRVLARVGRVFSVVKDDKFIDAAILLGGLFAMHPKPGGYRTIGHAFSNIKDESGSIEKRFVALLDADKEDLGDHLRHAISLLKAKNDSAAINWSRLLQDILDWENPSRYVQRQWARDYWDEPKEAQSEENSTTTTPTDNI
jgi:CRISPR system Cascade subunit CasB